ncbi:MAG TPA: hypothetical protein VH234_05520 [Candidatus Saccharimonadales bacterium]|nr:hypothetical protein [Candidatus Saccharimonadales bacterium]
MHVDLNCCFAILEQQANRLIRHKPVAVAAYSTPRGAVIASSYEAKALGIKLMVNVAEARKLCKDVIILTPDVEKIFDAHRRFRKVLLQYTSDVHAKSVDEFVVNFKGSIALQKGWSLKKTGYMIKKDIKKELGEYVTVNVGIAPNRFLAKLAAGLNKPDGLDIITHKNLREVYSNLELVDLPGINRRFKARLNLAGIFTPVQFLDAPVWKLKNEVFHSIVGYYWYLRLRGYEIDGVDFERKSFGQMHAIGQKTDDKEQLSRLLMKLCEKTGRRLRKHDFIACGIHLWVAFENRTFWAKGKKTKVGIYSTQDIYLHAQKLMDEVQIPCKATNIGVKVFNLQPATPVQLGLFDNSRLDNRSLAKAADNVNDRYGEFTVVPAVMANMDDIILRRVAFGSIKDIEY